MHGRGGWTPGKGWRIRRAVIVLAATAAWLFGAAGAASAHGDATLVGEPLTVPPGETVTFTGRLHYHRLVGTVTSDVPVTLSLVSEATGEAAVTRGPATHLRLNDLVRCCDDEAWAAYELQLHNPGAAPATTDATVRLVHDDLAVAAFRAESGIELSVAVFGLGWAALAWWAVRRRPRVTSLGGAAARFGLVAGLAVAIAVTAGWRYGGIGPAGLVAGFGALPVLPQNDLVSRAALLMLLAIVGWGWAGLHWIGARTSTGRGPWLLLGAALVGAVAVSGMLVTDEYGRGGVALAFALAAAIPAVAVLAAGAGPQGAERWLPARAARPAP